MKRYVPLSRRSKPRCLGPCRWPPARGSGGDGTPAWGQAETSGSHSWRERWLARLVGLSCASGALLAASATYLAGRMNAPEAAPPSSEGLTPAGMNDSFVARAMSALRAFEPPLSAVRLSSNSDGPGRDSAGPILPNLPVDGLKLAGVRAMPGEQGQMLCLVYARPAEANIALCVEKAVDQSDTVAHAAGNFPSAAIHWRQRGANYALVGALPEATLRSLADRVHAQVEAFDGRQAQIRKPGAVPRPSVVARQCLIFKKWWARQFAVSACRDAAICCPPARLAALAV